MRGIHIRYRLAAVLAVAVGTVIALTLPASAKPTVQVKSPPNGIVALEAVATLQANGAAVFTGLAVICPKGSSAYLNIVVTEVVDGAIVSGDSHRTINDCTGKPQALKIAVTPALKPFVRDLAFGQAEFSYYNGSQSRTGWDERTIRII